MTQAPSRTAPEEALERVTAAAGELVTDARLNFGSVDLVCQPARLQELMTTLRDGAGLRCRFFTFLSAVDRSELGEEGGALEVLIHVYSPEHRFHVTVHVPVTDAGTAGEPAAVSPAPGDEPAAAPAAGDNEGAGSAGPENHKGAGSAGPENESGATPARAGSEVDAGSAEPEDTEGTPSAGTEDHHGEALENEGAGSVGHDSEFGAGSPVPEAGEDRPTCPTITGIYSGAVWHERETHEMFGIVFVGHPRLANLMLPEDFDGFPLLKSFKLPTRIVKEWPGAKDPEEAAAGGR